MRAFLTHSSVISPRSIARILADFRWVVLGMAGIAAFALGCVGYNEYLNQLHTDGVLKHGPGPGDVAYGSLKLFFMSAPDQTGLPVSLDVARFLAPFVAGYAALSGLASLFRDRAQQMRIPLMRGHVVVCGLGYEAALALRHQLDGAMPLVVALSGAHGAAGLIADASEKGELRNTNVFPTLERTCTTELVQGGSFERIAVGSRWCVLQVEAGKPAPSWSGLGESRKDSSRAQARDIRVKLHSIGCTIAPLRDWGAPEFAFTDEEFETLAIAEHKRWITERLQSGWRLGPKDTERKLSPYLIPFADLPKDIADFDRDAVRQIPAALALVDLQAIRPPGGSARIGKPTLVNVPGNGAVKDQRDC
jgi:hypothetical protein